MRLQLMMSSDVEKVYKNKIKIVKLIKYIQIIFPGRILPFSLHKSILIYNIEGCSFWRAAKRYKRECQVFPLKDHNRFFSLSLDGILSNIVYIFIL